MKEFVVRDSGKHEEYPSGMKRDTDKGKPMYNLIDKTFLYRLAVHMTKGAEKYGRDNWRLANSQEELERFKESAFRHMMQWLNGDVDEDHMSAIAFNIASAEYVKRKLEQDSDMTLSEVTKKYFPEIKVVPSTTDPKGYTVIDLSEQDKP